MDTATALVAVATALTTVVGLFYRYLLHQIEELRKERNWYRDRYFGVAGLASIATDEAEAAK